MDELDNDEFVDWKFEAAPTVGELERGFIRMENVGLEEEIVNLLYKNVKDGSNCEFVDRNFDAAFIVGKPEKGFIGSEKIGLEEEIVYLLHMNVKGGRTWLWWICLLKFWSNYCYW